MSEGQGWAKRVTKATLHVFARFLRRAEDAARARQERAEGREAEQRVGESPFRGEPLRLPSRFTIVRRPRQASAPEPGTAAGPAPAPGPTSAPEPPVLTVPARGRLLWRKTLNRSDAQDPPAGTNPTGCVRLTQARNDNDVEIDQTTYFRHDVFGGFPWGVVRHGPLVEATVVPFHLTIGGEYLETADLQVRHKPSGEAEQGNYTTSLHWGELTPDIRNRGLTGRVLNLYAPAPGTQIPFFIGIV
jgi:hypothetical protein